MKLSPEQLQGLAGVDLDEATFGQLVDKLPKAEPIPGPYAVALKFSAALLAAGNYDDPAAAVDMGWRLVWAFYQGKTAYLSHGQTLHQVAAATRASASVGLGGETGNIGEIRAEGDQLVGSRTIVLAPNPKLKAYWDRIHDATRGVVDAQAVLEEARAKRDAIPAGKRNADAYQAADHEVTMALQAFNDAAAVQSKAYEPED